MNVHMFLLDSIIRFICSKILNWVIFTTPCASLSFNASVVGICSVSTSFCRIAHLTPLIALPGTVLLNDSTSLASLYFFQMELECKIDILISSLSSEFRIVSSTIPKGTAVVVLMTYNQPHFLVEV